MLLYFSVFTYWINKDCCNAQLFQFSPKTIAVKGRSFSLESSQWIILARLSWQRLYSVYASLLHSQMIRLTDLGFFPHILLKGETSCRSNSALMKFVLSAWSCAAVIIPSVSYLRPPSRSPSQYDLFLTSSVCLKIWPCRTLPLHSLIFQ